uniref:Sushi domain-containing protein n=1 Tax=Capra hircus TaxID=9925 RepID=A0A452E9D0_CAPHI
MRFFILRKHQIIVPHGVLDTKRKMAARPFSGLWKVSDPALLQMTLVAGLLASVFGDCGPPPNLQFASPNKLNNKDFKTGTTLKYTCLPGYSRISSIINFIFFLEKQCRNLEDLPNGKVEVKTDFLFGSTVEFSCSEGYILVGSATSHCEIQDKGVDWSDPLPQCIIVKCEPPPTISNERHNGGDEDFYTYGSSVTYSCDPDFSMLGKASISCTVENKTIGVWYPSPPTCKNSILFSCKKGYILNGNNLIRCDANNEWHPSPPTCELNSCIGLPDIPHAVWDRRDNKLSNQEVFEVGTELKYQCKFGYRPIPDEPLTLTCQENFTWTCPPLPPLCQGGNQTLKRPGTTLEVTPHCHNTRESPRYIFTIFTIIFLLMLLCDYCESPPVIAHGQRKIVSKLFAFEQQAVYECDEGYILIRVNRLSCAFSGYSPGAPQCKTWCVKPEIEYGRLSVEKVRYVEPERITIQCESGYSMVGSEIITCSEDRTWYPEAPKCEWEYPECCEQAVTGRKLLQCLSRPVEVKLALEVYKLSLETGQELQLLELQLEKPNDAS